MFHEQLIGQGDDIDVISCNQVRSYGHSVNNRAVTFGGHQCITLHESGTVIPLDLQKALISLKFRKPSQEEIDSCERITMTSDLPWNPSSINNHTDTDDNKYISLQDSATDNDLSNVNIAYADTCPVMNFKDCNLYYKSLDSYRSINLLELEPMIYGHTGLKDPMNILETNVNATSQYHCSAETFSRSYSRQDDMATHPYHPQENS